MNAKKELEEQLVDKSNIKCAIVYKDDYWEDKTVFHRLKVNHTEEELEEFLDDLNFDYDAGYGGQNLFGTVWLADGTWLSRGEYDGSEWWEHNVLPKIPEELL